MKFTLDIECDNAAFTDDGEESRNNETARILREIAKQAPEMQAKFESYLRVQHPDKLPPKPDQD